MPPLSTALVISAYADKGRHPQCRQCQQAIILVFMVFRTKQDLPNLFFSRARIGEGKNSFSRGSSLFLLNLRPKIFYSILFWDIFANVYDLKYLDFFCHIDLFFNFLKIFPLRNITLLVKYGLCGGLIVRKWLKRHQSNRHGLRAITRQIAMWSLQVFLRKTKAISAKEPSTCLPSNHAYCLPLIASAYVYLYVYLLGQL